ncbi:hypothetical protein L13192_02744 [Pyrenophora tritici-repentis]|nr:hypothetical protein L13192_02744 [Pyrenophora tritici-repentis]
MAAIHRNLPYDQEWQNKFEDLLEMLDEDDDTEFYDCVEN